MAKENFLTQKHGPLPTWAWGGLGVAAILAGLYIRNRSAASTTATTTTGTTGTDTTGTTVGPAGTTDTTGTTTADTLNGLQSQLNDLPTQIGQTVGDELAAYFGQPGPVDTGAGGGAVDSAATGGAAGATGFWWGGQYITSLKQFQAWRAKHGLPNNTLADWAFSHPGAARSIGLTPPSSMPHPKPNKSGGRIPKPPRKFVPRVHSHPTSVNPGSAVARIQRRFHAIAGPANAGHAVHRRASTGPAVHRVTKRKR